MNVAALWDQMVDAVCRPPRDDAYSEADLVGGRRASFRLYDRKYYREDVQLTNSRGQKLQGSHYRPCVVTSADGRLPVVIYCHCNSGSRRDAEEILFHLLPKGITVFAFDFAGSGLSEGSYVTLGALEVDDLAAVVQHLREEGSSSTIGLWGRSMGAVTALLYSQRDPSVAGMVLDSPFSRLVDLMLELATDQQLRIPKPLVKMALAMLKRSVRKRAGFSVEKVAPLECVGASFIPALFAHGKDDTFVPPHHSERLFQAYAGDKNFVTFAGEHNSVRPEFFYDSALIFLLQALHVAELVGPEMDLQAALPSQLPHLSPRTNSIYVTASRNLSQDLEDEGGAAASGEAGRSSRGAAAGGAAGSPRSRSPSPGVALSRVSSSMSPRQLNVPWALPPGRSSSGQHGEMGAVAAAVAGAAGEEQQQMHQHLLLQHQQGQHQRPLGQGVGQLASLLEAGDAQGEGLEGQLFNISEEEALQRALELSLQDAQQQQTQQQAQPPQQGEHQMPQTAAGSSPNGAAGAASQAQQQGLAAAEAAQGEAADAPLPLHLRYNAAFASSATEGRRNPLYGGTSVADVPADPAEEEAMLAAALAASLQVSQPQQAQQQQDGGQQQAQQQLAGDPRGEAPAPAAPADGGGPQALGGLDPKASSGFSGTASEAAELQHYYGSSGAAPPAPVGAADGEGQEGRLPGSAGDAGEEEEEVLGTGRASSLASQAAADMHTGQEAAAVRLPSLKLQEALGLEAAGAGAAGGAAGNDGGTLNGAAAGSL